MSYFWSFCHHQKGFISRLVRSLLPALTYPQWKTRLPMLQMIRGIFQGFTGYCNQSQGVNLVSLFLILIVWYIRICKSMLWLCVIFYVIIQSSIAIPLIQGLFFLIDQEGWHKGDICSTSTLEYISPIPKVMTACQLFSLNILCLLLCLFSKMDNVTTKRVWLRSRYFTNLVVHFCL